MVADEFSDRSQRVLSGVVVSLLGIVLFVVPVYDIWDDVTALRWDLLMSVVENATFLVLAAVLVVGGVWLATVDWNVRYVRTVANRTLVGTGVIFAVVGAVVLIQDLVMNNLKPYFLAMDAVLIGAATSFGLAIYTAKAAQRSEALSEASRLNDRLEVLNERTSELERVEDRECAFAVVRSAIDALFDPERVRVVVDDAVADGGAMTRDGEVQVVNGAAQAGADDPAMTAAIGDHGHIEVLDDPVPRHERKTVELLATHLAHALNRLERQEALEKQRERLEFVNRTVRHNLLNDVNVVTSRLEFVEPRPEDREHWATVRDRVEEMGSFIQTMRDYTNTIAREGANPRPMALRETLLDQVESTRRAYPAAEISTGSIPSVDVLGDELLGQVFANPLTNAVEHNDAATPKVAVRASVVDDAVRVEFADNGPGIAPDRKDRVFERGESAGKSAGTGFGLYLVKDAVESYGGSVDVRDNEPRGTVLEIRLPLADGHADADA